MQLPGKLSPCTLGDLLGQLHRNRITGVLELWEMGVGGPVAGGRHRVHLSCGLVTAVETRAQVPPLGEILKRQGRLGLEGIGHMLRRIAAGDARRAGEILVDEGLIDREIVDAALRAQLRSRLDTLFRLEHATVRFHTARPVPVERTSTLPPSDFLYGRPRARDRGRARPAAPAHARPRQDEPYHSASAHAAAPPSGDWHAPAMASHDDPRGRAWRMLGLLPDADSSAVRRAFRRLASELHPDRHATAPPEMQRRSAARFAELTEAYHLLVA